MRHAAYLRPWDVLLLFGVLVNYAGGRVARVVGGGGTFVKNKNHLSLVIYIYYHIGGGGGGGRWHWVFGDIGLRSRRYTI